jgi:hypothetical protein
LSFRGVIEKENTLVGQRLVRFLDRLSPWRREEGLAFTFASHRIGKANGGAFSGRRRTVAS